MSKNYYKTEDAPANAVGNWSQPDSSGATSGKVDMTKTKKKKKKSPWDKYSPDALGRQFRVENTEAPVAEPNITPDDTFAGVDVFKVDDTDFNNCKLGKRKYARWDKYVDVESETGKRITGYAKKHPKKSIIVQHDKTDHMLYLKKFEKGEE